MCVLALTRPAPAPCAGFALLAVLAVGCAEREDLALDNPVDAESDAYVGHEIRDPADPINVPTVEITDAPTRIKINVPYTYVATASDPNPARMPDAQPGEVRYDWDFGDGTVVLNGGASVEHTYAKTAMAGDTLHTFTVRVNARDDDANEEAHIRDVVVSDLSPRVTGATTGFDSVKAGRPMPFDGSAIDADGEIALYEWDFDGNGTYDWSSDSTAQAEYAYPSAPTQTYLARLRATDDDGNTGERPVDVLVTNHGPIVDPGGPYTVKINVPLLFAGSAIDPDGEIVLYEWDFEGDGAYDWSSPAAGQAEHTYPTAPTKTYEAGLRVTDNDGNVAEAAIDVLVTNHNPTVDAGGPYDGPPGQPIPLVGSATDDGQVVLYEWDFDADGTFDWSSASSASVDHVYGAVGEWTATLRARDDDGNTAAQQASVSTLPTWSSGPSMPASRSRLAAGAINGKLYVVGGSTHAGRTDALEIYDPSTNRWTSGPMLPTARYALAAGVIDRRLYVVGGWTGSAYSDALEIYDPSTNRWTSGPSLPTARDAPAAGVIDGRLYVVGGEIGLAYSDALEILGW